MSTDLPWWVLLLLPDDSNDLWTMVGALATVAVGFAAWRIALNQFELDLMPVLHVERKDGKTTITNCGRGLALRLYGMGSDGDVNQVAASLASTQSIDYSRVKLTITHAHTIYYANALGGWYSAKLVGSSFTGEDRTFQVGVETKRVRWTRLPKSVRLRRKRLSRSAAEHYEALSDRFGLEHWSYRVSERVKHNRLRLGKWWYGIGEDTRQKKYAALGDSFPDGRPTDEVRRTWELDLSGVSMNCWHTHPIDVEQYSCDPTDEGGRVVKIRLVSPFRDGAARGLVVVSPRTWHSVASLPRSQRSDKLWEQLTKYLCGRSPRDFFVCEL